MVKELSNMSGKKIKFGTSGWRGIIADDFTFDNIRLVSQAIADYLNASKRKPKAIIGSDARFMVEEFSAVVAEVLTANGINVLMCDRPTPTPVISYLIRKKKLTGGINLTASHNPYNYCGIKFNPADGGPAMPEVTEKIEESIEKIRQKPDRIKSLSIEEAKEKGLYEEITPVNQYVVEILKKLDVERMREHPVKAGVDMVYGTGNDFFDKILEEIYNDKKNFTFYNDFREPYFGGYRPEPDKKRLENLGRDVLNNHYDMGLALDGDADRFGIVDEKGNFISPNTYLAMVAYHLYKNKGYKGDVIRSIATSHQMDKVAEKFGYQSKITPVGFKYIGKLLNKGKYILGGEESGGLSIKNHVPEKDGILACLLAAEMTAFENKGLSSIKRDVEELTGSYYNARINIELDSNDQKEQIMENVGKLEGSFAGMKLKKRLELDGIGFQLDDGENDTWFLCRASGTEPVVRIYVESTGKKSFEKILEEVKNLK